MEWTAQIVSRDYKRGLIFVGVIFTNGEEKFSESMSVSGSDISSLLASIQYRLGTLENADILVPQIDKSIQDGTVIQSTKIP